MALAAALLNRRIIEYTTVAGLRREADSGGDAFGMIRSERGTMAVELIESLEHLGDEAVGIRGGKAWERAGHPGSITAIQVILDRAAVPIENGNDREGHPGTEQAELPVEFLEEDSLSEIVELLDDFLDGKVGAFGKIFGLLGD